MSKSLPPQVPHYDADGTASTAPFRFSDAVFRALGQFNCEDDLKAAIENGHIDKVLELMGNYSELSSDTFSYEQMSRMGLGDYYRMRDGARLRIAIEADLGMRDSDESLEAKVGASAVRSLMLMDSIGA